MRIVHIDNPTLGAELAANCRRIAVEEYDLRIQARRYLELYTSLTDGRGGLKATKTLPE